MSRLNESSISQAQKISDEFITDEGSGEYYCYMYLGKATLDATTYTSIDGKLLQSGRVWHLDQSKHTDVCYIGRGTENRINSRWNHPVFPKKNLRILLKSNLTLDDSIKLEKLLIENLGCILDRSNPDGCLTNTRLFEGGPFCCKKSEASSYKQSVQIVAMRNDKTIISSGSGKELSEELEVSSSFISGCCHRKHQRIYVKKLQAHVYFCFSKDFEIFKPIKKRQTSQPTRKAKMKQKPEFTRFEKLTHAIDGMTLIGFNKQTENTTKDD
jgi:hypothetical protein